MQPCMLAVMLMKIPWSRGHTMAYWWMDSVYEKTFLAMPIKGQGGQLAALKCLSGLS